MCGTAAHLATHVLPDVPVRQWVLTAPSEVRRALALRPEALTAYDRLFVEAIARWQKQKAKAAGIDGGETGSVTFVQRFNSTLGSFVHLHFVALDGVFTRTGAGVVFHEGPAPTRDEIETLAGRVAERMTQWLGRRGLLDRRPAEERSNEALELSPLEACMQVSLFGGTFLRLDKDGVPLAGEDDRHRSSSKSPWAAEVHAGQLLVDGADLLRAWPERLLERHRLDDAQARHAEQALHGRADIGDLDLDLVEERGPGPAAHERTVEQPGNDEPLRTGDDGTRLKRVGAVLRIAPRAEVRFDRPRHEPPSGGVWSSLPAGP
jgi:hypothetical protein